MAALVIIRPHALQVYFSDHNAPLGIPIPPEAVRDMEVVSEDVLTGIITKTLKQSGTPVQTIMVLSDELCFVEAAREKEEAEAIKTLVTDTPFIRVATVTLKDEKEHLVIAANQDLYENIGKGLEAAGFSVSAVVSWRGLLKANVTTSGEIDNVTVKRAFDSLSALRAASFPFSVNQVPLPKPEDSKNKPEHASKLPVGWLIFGGLALLYAVGMIVFMVIR